MIKFLKKIFGDRNQREIARLQEIVQEINALEPHYLALSDEKLHTQTEDFRQRLTAGESLAELLPEAFAAVREASRRTIGLRHYDVQLIGGMILHEGQVTEMRTGEGKTLVATLPLYLNALTGQGAYLVTPNDYLAKFGAQWMGPVYQALGMSLSIIQSGSGHPDESSYLYDPEYTSADDRFQYLSPITRRAAYHADITYGTNNEFGFDYLRDNMVRDIRQRTQSERHYAIIDEVDSILIDEARTPLIISGPADEPSEFYSRFASIVPRLQAEEDYEIEESTLLAMLTEAGVAKVEHILGLSEEESLYDSQHAQMLPYLDNALRAQEFYHRDKEYVVRNGEIIIVDQFTGRMMFGRRYSEGLHQAIEAKERVDIRRESFTHATITFQNFFRMYAKLAGMTGTAATEEEELRRIYRLDVIILPTNVEYRAQFGELKEQEATLVESGVEFAGLLTATVATPYEQLDRRKIKVAVFDHPSGNERYYRRLDMPDQIYKTTKAKFNAVVAEVQAVHQGGRPVLVGTTAIETSEKLSRLLDHQQIPHNMLNAKYHEREALTIAQAGQPGAVTIATNMAGRGVDILLGGNPEGMARNQLRKEGVDLTQIRSADWESALKLAQQGTDPSAQYPARWAEVLKEKVRQCQSDRQYVYQQGGLHVIGTERHEARRIDNQLRGRAGRQGDPGSSHFYISLEDELMRRFGGERLQPWMERAGLEDAPLEFKVISKVIGSIQERVEGYNFDVRKHVLEYDNVVNQQRTVGYAERQKILAHEDLHDDLLDMVTTEIRNVVQTHTAADYPEDWNLTEMLAELRRFAPIPATFTADELTGQEPEELIPQFVSWAEQTYQQLNQRLGQATYQSLRDTLSLKQLAESDDPFFQTLAQRAAAELGAEALATWLEQPLRRLPDRLEVHLEKITIELSRLFRDRRLMLQVLDEHWVHHLTALDVLREGIGLRAIGKHEPLVAYQKEAYNMYQEMLASVQRKIVYALFLVPKEMLRKRSRRSRLVASHQKPAALRNLRATAGNVTSTEKPRPHTSKKLPGRNDSCWCGSGKKYKNCHLRSDHRQANQ
ncbi:MAG: SEC-C domain-containing protein [Anaerolineae bacterium]|nr:SEC-C domain-containing protein [Anaerolineae bacterium]